MNCHFWPVENNLRRLEKKVFGIAFLFGAWTTFSIDIGIKINKMKKYFLKRKLKHVVLF